MTKKIGFYGGKFLPFHTGHLHSVLTAMGECDELHVIMFHNPAEEAKWISRSKFPKHMLRAAYREMVIRATLKDYPEIKFHVINSMAADITAKQTGISLWQAEANEVIDLIGQVPNVVFSSEPSYDADFKKSYPGCTHKLIDVDRTLFPISGTEMRRDGAYAHWDYVVPMYKRHCAKRVLVVGTESCGKSTLVRKLANVFNTTYVHEYGRDICNEYGTGQPPIEAYAEILYGQKMLEKQARESANKVYFVDTDSVVTEYYANLYESSELELAHEMSLQGAHQYDLVLFLEPDVKWVDDGMRKHGDQKVREDNSEMLKFMYKEYGYDLTVLSGSYNDKYMKAVELVKGMIG